MASRPHHAQEVHVVDLLTHASEDVGVVDLDQARRVDQSNREAASESVAGNLRSTNQEAASESVANNLRSTSMAHDKSRGCVRVPSPVTCGRQALLITNHEAVFKSFANNIGQQGLTITNHDATSQVRRHLFAVTKYVHRKS